MSECFLSAPHRYDSSASAIVNVFGNPASTTCPSGFLAGFSLASYILLIGSLATVLLWKRSRFLAGGLFAASVAYWALIKLSKLRIYDGTAVASQALFELALLAAAPLALASFAVRLLQSHTDSNEERSQ